MKIVCNSYYAHISNVEELKKIQGFMAIYNEKFKLLPSNFVPVIVKYNKNKKSISFIECYDWDEENEPSVGDSIVFSEKYPAGKLIKKKGQIYHHKWSFVSVGYTGFDIKKSKERSLKWQQYCDAKWKSKIGYRKAWNEFLELYGIEK